ncbi:hypothetical protein TBR22_A52200 [Luteitalea sp. TBR-22]|uniref:hypothetical protein n=1 Tax=Luteitalea sp. TBR-22 TaxID=2802971 RepID=UPI001AFC421B|nr:hypothetical protein [Luteitalea sp. TBR-22]BCS35983.1 hypothetical protein TBR22_A52200 [Luteitalea sp. TBR-22]
MRKRAALGHPASVRQLSRPWLVVGAVGLSLTLQLSDGFYHPPALAWLGLALVATLLGVSGITWPWSTDDELDGAVTSALLTVGVLVSAVALVSAPLARYMADPRPWAHPTLLIAVAVALVTALTVRATHGRAARRLAAAVLMAVGLWVGAWTVRESPEPHIDVIPVHQDAFAAVARGHSPYGITFANIYDEKSPFYAREMRDGQRVLFGFPYPPLSLALAWPGYAVLGDLRYSEVLAMAITLALIVSLGTEPALLAAAALLLAPRLVFHLEQGWTEPFPIVLLALTVVTARRWPSRAWLPLGLLVASKQHMVLALAFAPFLVDRSAPATTTASPWRFMAKAVLVAAAVTLPLALLDVDAFIRSAVLLQLREPFRLDSLSFTRQLLLWGVPLDKQGAMAVSLGAGLLGLGLSWWRAPRTPAGFAAALGTTCFLLTAFGKKAFLNYYFLVVACLLIAVAADDGRKGRSASAPILPQ